MTLRSFGYWLFLCMIGLGVVAYAGGSMDQVVATRMVRPAASAMVSDPEQNRSICMFIGLFGVAVCYRQAWRNFRHKA